MNLSGLQQVLSAHRQGYFIYNSPTLPLLFEVHLKYQIILSMFLDVCIKIFYTFKHTHNTILCLKIIIFNIIKYSVNIQMFPLVIYMHC